MATPINGYRRADGRAAVRNHVLVLPSVVCASHAAGLIVDGADATVIVHQHGCLHVGDDLVHTEAELLSTATSPNVGAVVVVSLGCETLNGKRLADRIRELGARVELVGIQASGGTRRAVEDGRDAVARLGHEVAGQSRVEISTLDLVVGIDNEDRFAEPLADALRARGIEAVTAPDGLRGPEAHVALTRAGAQVIVCLPGPDEGPIGFAISPVVAVDRGAELHAALADDFDVAAEPGEDDATLATRVVGRVVAHANGEPTASERRRSDDFVLQRLAVTM